MVEKLRNEPVALQYKGRLVDEFSLRAFKTMSEYDLLPAEHKDLYLDYISVFMMNAVLEFEGSESELFEKLHESLEEILDGVTSDFENLGNGNIASVDRPVSLVHQGSYPDFIFDQDAGASSITITNTLYHELLNHDQEMYLTRLVKMGDKAKNFADVFEAHTPMTAKIVVMAQVACEDLVRHNQRLVMDIVNKEKYKEGVELADLTQIGNVGLLRAIKKFDPETGNRFSTYATWWIRQAVGRTTALTSHLVRLPVHQSDRLTRVRRARGQLWRSGQPILVGKIAEMADVSVELAQELLDFDLKMRNVAELDRETAGGSANSDNDDSVLADIVASPLDTEQEASDNILRTEILEVLDNLSPRVARIMKYRFGLYDGEVWTLDEIAKVFGLTRERIRQIIEINLRRLHNDPVLYKKLKNYL